MRLATRGTMSNSICTISVTRHGTDTMFVRRGHGSECGDVLEIPRVPRIIAVVLLSVCPNLTEHCHYLAIRSQDRVRE